MPKPFTINWNDPLIIEIRQQGCSYIFDDTKMEGNGPQPFIPVEHRNKKCGKKCVAKSLYCGAHKKFVKDRKNGCVYDMFNNGDKCGDKCVSDTLYCKEHVCYR